MRLLPRKPFTNGERDKPPSISHLEGITPVTEGKTFERYEIIHKLGQGSTGIVYLGKDQFIKRHVAIKISRPTSEHSLQRLLLEAQSAGRLNHPNIIAVYDAGLFDDHCNIIMEYVDGPTLDKFCRKDNLLPIGKVLETLITACNALNYAHNRGVIHRDIKPSNIMLDVEGVLKVTDFGIAHMNDQTAQLGLFGTPSYMSPEQLKDEIVVSNSDIFSLGCVLYELLVGERAFLGENNYATIYKIINQQPKPVSAIRPGVPAVIEKIIEKALEKEPKDRYQTCMEFANALEVAFRRLTSHPYDKKVNNVIDFIHHLPFFQNFSKGQVKELVSSSKIVKLRKGNVILSEGDVDDTFYVVLSGKTKVIKNNIDIAFIDEGECFGEMAYIAGQPRVADVLAVTDCLLLKINSTLLDRSSEAIQLLFFKHFASTLVRRLSKNPTVGNHS